MDGAEFYSNSEYNVWSLASSLAGSQDAACQVFFLEPCPEVWDIKFPLVIIPHEAMKKPSAPSLQKRLPPIQAAVEVKAAVHRHVCKLLAWSMRFAARGLWPTVGYRNEIFQDGTLRASMAGQPLAKPWRRGSWFHKSVSCHMNCFDLVNFRDRFAYFCCRFDHKARYEANFFPRYYSCKYICEVCAATRETCKGSDALSYCDFNADAARHLTRISNDEYHKTCDENSPWSCMEGWTVRSATHDLMHTLYLGIARDLVPSLLADWIDLKILGSDSCEKQLAALSREMRLAFKQAQCL